MAYGWLVARSGLRWSETDVFDTMAMWLVVVMFTVGLWLTVHAVWGMASDSRARRLDDDALATTRRLRATRSP